MIPLSEGADIVLPYWLFFVLLGVALISTTGLVFLARYYRRRLSVSAGAVPVPPPRFNTADWHPDVRPRLEKELAEIKSNYEQLRKTYNVLLTRHKTLIREVQRHQQGIRRAPQQAAPPRQPQASPQAAARNGLEK